MRASLPALLLLTAVAAPAQVTPNRATRYLYPTDVTDARAVWVNPAGLGRFEAASVHLDMTVSEPGSAGRLRQLTLGFSSRGLSFGYQRDVFDGGRRGHTYSLGLASGHQQLAAGVAAALYRGEASETGWDVGAVYDAAPALSIGATVRNIGRPTVRGTTLPVTYVPSVTARLFASRATLSVVGRLSSAELLGYSAGAVVGLREGTRWPLRALARVDVARITQSLRRAGFAFGLSVGAEDLVGAVATTPADADRVDALSLYGVSTRRFDR